MIKMGRKAKKAGFKLSITVLNGIAGRKRSQIHAKETGRVLITPGVKKELYMEEPPKNQIWMHQLVSPEEYDTVTKNCHLENRIFQEHSKLFNQFPKLTNIKNLIKNFKSALYEKDKNRDYTEWLRDEDALLEYVITQSGQEELKPKL